MLFTILIGGVRVLVPEAYLERAREIVKADARGDYALDDRADGGPPPAECLGKQSRAAQRLPAGSQL